jgi:hypothetical protein
MSHAVSTPQRVSAAPSGRDTPLPDRDGVGASKTEGAPLALQLLETVYLFDGAGPPSSPRRLGIIRRELLGAAGDLERVGLVVLRDAGAGHGVWVSLSGAGRHLLTTGYGRRAG